MPEYLAPGVFVEETSFRAKPLEGVSTSTTAFVGPTRTGPLVDTPEIVTSVGEFERMFGGTRDLTFTARTPNYLAHAVRAFFDNGGRRLFVARTFVARSDHDGHAVSPFLVGTALTDANRAHFRARFPGSSGNGRIELTEVTTPAAAASMARALPGTMLRTGAAGAATLTASVTGATLPLTLTEGAAFTVSVNGAPVVTIRFPAGSAADFDAVTLAEVQAQLAAARAPLTAAANAGKLQLATQALGSNVTLTIAAPASGDSALTGLGLTAGTVRADDVMHYFVKVGETWRDDSNNLLDVSALVASDTEFVSLNAVAVDSDGNSKNFEDLAYSSTHPRYIGNVLTQTPPRRSDQLENRFALVVAGTVSAFALRRGFVARPLGRVNLDEGNDGQEPTPASYVAALALTQSIEDISIVATPGASALSQQAAIRAAVIAHVERRRAYQIAVLDTPREQTVTQARDARSDVDSKYAALYYPWVRIANPDLVPSDVTTPREIDVPPSGFVCGIYARNDAERGVHKAPANEVVRGALRFEVQVNTAQQELLNPSGINVLRSFPERGHRVWGARLASSDPEWKYVNIRRYFNYVEASIDRGTQWVVFEPNGERLWARVRTTISDYLYSEWRNGALLGATPAEAFFVRCDRSTMTQSDLDNGRLICEIGIAVVGPAEFVIFRVGQKTADARS